MSKERFIGRSFRPASIQQLVVANRIIAKYLQAGLRLTLRQLYYQFVAHHGLPNTERSYKNLASLISDGRLAGIVDWAAIEDRGRVPYRPSEWTGVPDLIESSLAAFRLPRWAGQKHYVELWVEKQALAGVLEPLADEFHVTLMVNKGYSSQSAMYEAAKRFARGMGQTGERDDEVLPGEDPYGLVEYERPGVLIYLGDHDPSGEDMVRDIDARLRTFGLREFGVLKLALTIEQVQRFKLPPNPAKMSDSRAEAYVAKYGKSSWEVDALDPDVLARMVRTSFAVLVDRPKMDRVIATEEKHKAKLRALVKREKWAR